MTAEDSPVDSKADSSLDDVRRSLYSGSRATFVERRKELASASRATGDRDRAKLIEKMRKPAAAAHLVNLLAHADERSLRELVELGADVRRAMAEGDDPTIRSLLRGRPGAIAATAAQAHEVAREHGVPLSGAVGDQIVQTLRAAMASDEAAELVRSGTLTEALAEPGFDGVGIESAPRAPVPTRSARSVGSPRGPARRKRGDPDDLEAGRAERAAAQARITSSEAAVKVAEEALTAVTERRDGLERDRERLAAQLTQIDDDLVAVRTGVDEAESVLADARAEIQAARDAVPD